VWAQTVRPSEVILVDDCSTDRTVSIAESLTKESPVPMRLIRLPRNSGGPGRPMNVGIREARADVVAFLDQDDLMDPAKVELVAGVGWDGGGIGLAFGRFRTFASEDRPHPADPAFYAIFPAHPAILDGGEVIDAFLTHGYRFGGAGGTAVHRRC